MRWTSRCADLKPERFVCSPRLPNPKLCLLTGFCAFPVNRIKELHKVTVRIPPDNEKSNLIRIEGDPQGVQEAKKELLELASRMVSRGPIECGHGGSPTGAPLNTLSPPQENERTKDLIIEQRFHRAIIGQKGEKIKEVRDKFPEVSRIACVSAPKSISQCARPTLVLFASRSS